MTKIQLSSLALWPEIYICDTFPLCQSLGQTQVCVCICTYSSMHPVVWPLCPLLAMPPRDTSISSVGCLAATAHNSVSVCFGRKQLPCGGGEKSRANTFRISASGQINFSLNCHHKGLFFLPLSFGWYL